MKFTAPVLEVIESERDRFRAAALSRHTIASYGRDLRVFTTWCAAAERIPIPASTETVELYVTDLIHRGRKVSTVARHLSGIQHAHLKMGLPNPCTGSVRAVLAGAKRLLAQSINQKKALSLSQLRAVITAIGSETAIQSRNCALLIFGFATALRRSNLASLRHEDLTILDDGIIAYIRHEKQDRAGTGRTVSVPRGSDPATCAVRAIKDWIEWRGNLPGPLFQAVYQGKPTGNGIRTTRIAQIIQDSVSKIGLSPRSYAGHSLRAGFITEAILAGITDHEICQHTGHRSLEMLRTYFRPVYALRQNPCHKIGL